MSVTQVIRLVREEVESVESWKSDHKEAIQVLRMEDSLGRLINAFQTIERFDEHLHSEALKAGAEAKAAVQYKNWTHHVTEIIKCIIPLVSDMLDFARRIHYETVYKNPKYRTVEIRSFLNELKWFVNPDSHLLEVLRPVEEIERDYREGRCEKFTGE